MGGLTASRSRNLIHLRPAPQPDIRLEAKETVLRLPTRMENIRHLLTAAIQILDDYEGLHELRYLIESAIDQTWKD